MGGRTLVVVVDFTGSAVVVAFVEIVAGSAVFVTVETGIGVVVIVGRYPPKHRHFPLIGFLRG